MRKNLFPGLGFEPSDLLSRVFLPGNNSPSSLWWSSLCDYWLDSTLGTSELSLKLILCSMAASTRACTSNRVGGQQLHLKPWATRTTGNFLVLDHSEHAESIVNISCSRQSPLLRIKVCSSLSTNQQNWLRIWYPRHFSSFLKSTLVVGSLAELRYLPTWWRLYRTQGVQSTEGVWLSSTR